MTQKKTYEVPTDDRIVQPTLRSPMGGNPEFTRVSYPWHQWAERMGRGFQGVSEQIETEGSFVGATPTDTAVMLDRIFAKITGA